MERGWRGHVGPLVALHQRRVQQERKRRVAVGVAAVRARPEQAGRVEDRRGHAAPVGMFKQRELQP